MNILNRKVCVQQSEKSRRVIISKDIRILLKIMKIHDISFAFKNSEDPDQTARMCMICADRISFIFFLLLPA